MAAQIDDADRDRDASQSASSRHSTQEKKLMTNEMTAISMSRADVTHVTAVIAILNDATQYKIERGDMAWGRKGRSEQSVLTAIDGSELFVVQVDGEVVGTTCLQWDDEHYWGNQLPNAGYIHGLAVRRDFHGRGIGALVLDWAMDQISVRQRQFLRLDCGAKNAGLCRYYECQGFIQVGQRVLESGYVAALYQREISSWNSGQEPVAAH